MPVRHDFKDVVCIRQLLACVVLLEYSILEREYRLDGTLSSASKAVNGMHVCIPCSGSVTE